MQVGRPSPNARAGQSAAPNINPRSEGLIGAASTQPPPGQFRFGHRNLNQGTFDRGIFMDAGLHLQCFHSLYSNNEKMDDTRRYLAILICAAASFCEVS